MSAYNEKQIEEMRNCITCMHYYYCYRNQKACDNGEVAHKNLFNEVEEQGCEHYTHEDSVVLSKEEYERTVQEKLKLGIEMGKRQSGKETIEKFVDLLTNNGKRQTLPIEDDKGNICDKAYIIPQSHLNQVVQQLGIEIKE